MPSTRDAYRRRQARRSTIVALSGIALIAVGVVLTLAKIGGNLLPTVLALVGAGTLIAGIVIGFTLVMNNFRYRQDQSYYDE